MSSIYYAAAWTECGCHISCSHQHRTVGDAVPCIRRPGGYVVAVDAGALRSLTPEEEADFRCASQPCTDTPIVQITSAVADGQTIGESGYAVMTRIRMENHLKWVAQDSAFITKHDTAIATEDEHVTSYLCLYS